MSDNSKVTAAQLRRLALVYVRQSTTSQVQYNRESTERQYRLAARASELGWQREQIKVLDQDLGISGSGLAERAGFTHMTAEVALGHVGIVLGLEVSRLARNNADWYRLLDLCGTTDTLIGDADGIYHPGMFNDRLVLGLKGTMSEKPNYMCCAPAITAASATRRHAVNCGADCQSVHLGRSRRRVFCCPTKRSAARSGRCSSVSPRWAPHARCGYGFVNRVASVAVEHIARNALVYPELYEDPWCSAIQSMRPLTSMVKLVRSAI
jgi:hypothetical protein